MNSFKDFNAASHCFAKSNLEQKAFFRESLSSMKGVELDFGHALAKVLTVIGESQVDNLRKEHHSLQFGIQSWESEILTSIRLFREKLYVLFQDLLYITPQFENDPLLSRKLKEACNSMPAFSDILPSRISFEEIEQIDKDKMEVIFSKNSHFSSEVELLQIKPMAEYSSFQSSKEITQRELKFDKYDEPLKQLNEEVLRASVKENNSVETQNKEVLLIQDLVVDEDIVLGPHEHESQETKKEERGSRRRSATDTQFSSFSPRNIVNQDELLKLIIMDAQKDFNEAAVEVIELSCPASKTECDLNCQTILYGGDSIGLLSKRQGWLIDDGLLFDNKTCTLKALKNSNYLVNDFDTWSIFTLDQNFIEKAVLRGVGTGAPPNYKSIKTRNSDDDEYVLWWSSQDNLTVIKTSNMSSKEIRDFWKVDGQSSLPLACAISTSGKKIVAITNHNDNFMLLYYEGNDQVVMYCQKDVHPKIVYWNCLEINYDQDFFLVGGSTGERNGALLLLTLNEDCELIGEASIPQIESVNCLRRHSQGDIFFAGGYQTITVLLHRFHQIFVVNQVQLSSGSYLADLTFNHKTWELFGVDGSNHGYLITFNEHSQSIVKSEKMPAKELRKTRKLGIKKLRGSAAFKMSITSEENHSIQTKDGVEEIIAPEKYTDYGLKQLSLPDSKNS